MRLDNIKFIIIYPICIFLAFLTYLTYLALYVYVKMSKRGWHHLISVYIILKNIKLQFLVLLHILRVVTFHTRKSLSFISGVERNFQYKYDSARTVTEAIDIIGICFLTNNFDSNQLKVNINFFSRYFKQVILVKNGGVRFDIDLTDFDEALKVTVVEEYGLDFQNVFIKMHNKFVEHHIVKFDDDDCYITGCVELLYFISRFSKVNYLGLKPLLYQFIDCELGSEFRVSRRFLFPTSFPTRFFDISGSLIFCRKGRRALKKLAVSKYLDKSLSEVASGDYLTCFSFSTIVRRLPWRGHASVVGSEMKNNMFLLHKEGAP